MAKKYKGTKITGTSTSAKVFKKSDVKNASKGDTYTNMETGHQYKCTKGGKPSEAKWKYTGTTILFHPQEMVGLKTPKRRTGGSRWLDATWTTPKSLTNKKCGWRAEGLYETWMLDISGSNDPTSTYNQRSESDTGSSINLSNFKGLTRSSFYPNPGKPYLYGATVEIRPYNRKGRGPIALAAYRFAKPRKPSVGRTSIDENGIVSCTITTNAGEDEQERYDTRIQVDVYDSSEAKPQWRNRQDYSTTATSHTATIQVPNWQVAGKYVLVRFRACARGYAGDSAWSSYSTHTVGWPKPATIDGKKVTVPSKNANAIATFPISVNADANHKTDQVVLQKLVNVTASTAAQATAMSESWQDTDYKDDGQCTALACSVGDLLPDEGKYSWVRVKSWHDVEGVFFIYSEPYRVRALETAAPTASDDAIKLFDPEQGVNGSSCRVTMAWNADGLDDADGTQLTWSDEPDAWESTEKPQEFEFTESDGQLVDGSTTYRDSRTIVIKGLAEGEPTHVRARRYMDDVDGNRTYGPWSDQKTVIPTVAPSDVVLAAPAFVAEGADVTYTWAFGGGGTQRGWQLVSGDAIVAEGTDAFGTATIPAARFASFADSGGIVSAFVRVSTGGEYIASDAHATRIVPAPTLAIGELPTMTAQGGYSIPLTCGVSTARVAIVVTADGADMPTPTGTLRQPAGDAVWSGELLPQWAASGDAYAADVPLPGGLTLLDGGWYTVTARATDPATGLQSGEQSAQFRVVWAHQAPMPQQGGMELTADAAIVEGKAYFTRTGSGTDADPYDYEEVETPTAADLSTYYEEHPSITVEPSTVTDDDGGIDRVCTITLLPPDGAAEGDVYDIYRLTHEGARLIGSGWATSGTVTDTYAPFGDGQTAYRICTRTADGDLAWADFGYSADGGVLRLDFAGREHRYVELPYDLSLGDKLAKDYEGRAHMDGSRGGGWNPGIGRTASLSTDVLRIENPETVAALYDMAQTAGPVFVRTPAGAAFEANVEADMDMDNDQVLSVALDAEECGLTDEFMLMPDYQEG